MAGRFYFCIEVKGFLPQEWPTWFEGLDVSNLPDGQLQINGTLADQAAFFGILYQVNNLGMDIKNLKCSQLTGTSQKGDQYVPTEIQDASKTAA
jgi:hypothetical protein